MKTQKFTLVCLICLTAGIAVAGTGEIKDKIQYSASVEEELELLQEFLMSAPIEFEEFPSCGTCLVNRQANMNFYKIYDENLALVLEGQLSLENDIENEELSRLISNSVLLMQDNSTFIYQLER